MIYSFVYEKIDILIILSLFIISIMIGNKRKIDYDAKTLEYDGLGLFCYYSISFRILK